MSKSNIVILIDSSGFLGDVLLDKNTKHTH